MRQNARIAWAIFLVFGAAAAYLRYGALFWPDQHAALKQDVPGLLEAFQGLRDLGPWLLLACHVAIVIGALREAMFQGILCALIPLYSFYFLLVVWDHFLLRAVVGVLLVGVGQDSAAVYQNLISSAIDTVTRWISSGG